MEESSFLTVIYIVQTLVVYTYLSDWFETRFKQWMSLLLSLLCYTPAIICCILWNNIVINTLMYFVSNLFMIGLCFNSSKARAVIHAIILTMMNNLSREVVLSLYGLCLNVPTNSFKNDFNDFIIVELLSQITYLMVAKSVSYFLTRRNRTRQKLSGHHAILLIFPAIIFILLFIEMYITSEVKMPTSINVALSVTNVMSLIFSILVFVYYDNLTKREQEYQDIIEENLINSIDKTYIGVLESQYESTRIFVHDIKSHLFTIYNMKSIDDVDRYIEHLLPTFEKNIIKYGTGNHILDIILDKYQVICEKLSIDFYTSIVGTNLSYIDDMELSSLLNNVMDNAVEAVCKTENKKIEFVIRKENESYDVISVVNTCAVKPKKGLNGFATIKSDSKLHGIGTKSIKKCVERNNGQVYMRYEDKDKMFHFTALLKCPKNKNAIYDKTDKSYINK